jgi:hypothetical protein
MHIRDFKDLLPPSSGYTCGALKIVLYFMLSIAVCQILAEEEGF